MELVARQIDGWIAAGRRVALGTVVATRSSTPRPVGSHVAVCETGETAGAVSGGCVETAVRDLALEVLSGRPARIATYGAAVDDIGIGLPCGGEIDVLVEVLDPAGWAEIRRRMGSGRPFVIRTPLGAAAGPHGLAVGADGRRTGRPGPRGGGPSSGARAPRTFADLAGADLRNGIETGPGGRRVFVEVVGARPRLVVVGADDVAAALCAQARLLGWATVAVDAREALATPGRLPAAEEIVVGWPGVVLAGLALDGSSAVVVATHEQRFDVPALVTAVRSPAFYVGALGSRSSTAARRARLVAAGLDDAEIARISGPTGLDLGAETPAETALAIVAEIQAVRGGRPGGRLADGTGPIHGQVEDGRPVSVARSARSA